jgi:hypothetical protein
VIQRVLRGLDFVKREAFPAKHFVLDGFVFADGDFGAVLGVPQINDSHMSLSKMDGPKAAQRSYRA